MAESEEVRLRFLNQHEREVFVRLYKWWLTGGTAFDVQDTLTADATLILPAYSTQVDVDTTSGNVTVTLPGALKNIGRRVEITKTVAANTLTVASSDLIDGSATVAWTTQWTSRSFISRGDTWRIV